MAGMSHGFIPRKSSLEKGLSPPKSTLLKSQHNPANAYGDWISAAYPWQWFITMTSRNRTHPEAMLKRFKVAVCKTHRTYLGRNPRMSDQVVWVAAMERHKSGNPHLHALAWQRHDLNKLSSFSRREFQRILEELSGWSKVEAPRSNGCVSGYVAKYLSKEGEIEFSPTYGAHGAIDVG